MCTIHSVLMQSGRVAAVTLFTAAASIGLSAQQSISATQARPVLNLQAASKAPADLFETASSSSSTSSTATSDAVATERFNLSDTATQPPPRRRYGRPHYTDNMHNADGSNKYLFEVGGGFTLPTGGSHHYLSTSYGFQGGVGRNFTKKVAVVAQFDWANFGIQTNRLNQQLALYNSFGATDQNGAPLTQLGGSSHIWSFTLNPIYNFAQTDKSGAYVVAGVGFYHKTANFTIPSIGQSCDPYYGCFQYQANQSIDKYTSNSAGVNGGIGYTYKFSRFANQQFFAEARYVYTANSRRAATGTTAANTPPGSHAFNAFPENSAPTTYIPITFGIRF